MPKDDRSTLGDPSVPGLRHDSTQVGEPSPNQLSIWLRQAVEPESIANHLFFAFRVFGTLDEAALRWSMQQMIERHEALRTTFHKSEEGVLRSVHPTLDAGFSYEPAEEWSNEDLAERLRAELIRPFDLEKGPLGRILVFRRGPDEHVVVTAFHHIIADMWSLLVFQSEWLKLHQTRIAGGDVAEAQLPRVRAWTPQSVRSTDDEDSAFWRQKLSGLADLTLPTDFVAPVSATGHGAWETFTIDADLAASLRNFARESGTSPFVVGLSAFACLLHRVTASTDFAIGTPKAGRTHRTAGVLGYFVNSMVLRCDLSGNPSFEEVLARTQRTFDEAQDHENYPLQYLVNDLRSSRPDSSTPLFRTAFLWQKSSRLLGTAFGPAMALGQPGIRTHVHGLELESMRVELRPSPADLSLVIGEIGDELVAMFEYRRDLFGPDTVARIARAWLTVLSAGLADPLCGVGELSLVSGAELEEFVSGWAASVAPFDSGVGVHELFEARVAQDPGRLAVGFEGAWLSYGELNARANRLARLLVASGVGRGDLVGVHLERSLEMVVAVLAVLKAGGAYVPLDPEFPGERLAFMVADCGARVVVTESSLLVDGGLGWAGVHCVVVDRESERLAGFDDVDLSVGCGGGDLAYVIYTSGSSGRPKGVEVEHRSVVNLLTGLSRRFGVSSDDVVFAAASLSFDVSVSDFFLPLVSGARVVVASRDTVLDPGALATQLRDTGVTMAEATPTTWRMLIEDGWSGDPALTVVCGGEAMPRALADALLPRCAAVWNSYGPTETTVTATMFRVVPGSGVVPIGSPIDNTRLYVLDAQLQLLPVGIPGELFIGGDGLARGYLNRPELTAERFPTDPFRRETGARMYRTGDLVRRRADGVIEYLGRLDTQVKLRGYRIELGEIETLLTEHPSVRDAAVVAREFGPADVRLVAYVIPHDDDNIDPTTLRDHLQTQLPTYMVPAVYIEIEQFPLTPNNKIDRNALPAPQSQHQQPLTRSPAPHPGIETQLAEIWQDLLGIEGIGRDDNFFDLGGHSLLAVRLFARILHLTDATLPLTTLFRAPTIAELAEVMRGKGWTPDWTSLVAIQPGGERQPFFHVAPFQITALSFSHLARHLGPDQPLYGLQPQGMDDEQPFHDSIEEIAAHYISEMKQVQPFGPYAIGGHCAGSWVAFEMALQLQKSGDEINVLLLVDAEPPNFMPPKINRLRYLWSRMSYYATSGRLPNAIRWKAGLSWQHLLVRRVGSPDRRRVARVRAAHAEAHWRYRAYGIVDGNVTLIRSSESSKLPDKDWHLRWEELVTGRLTVEVVPGTHASLVETGPSREVAEKIRAVLRLALDNAHPTAELKRIDEVTHRPQHESHTSRGRSVLNPG